MKKCFKWLMAGAAVAVLATGYCIWQNEDIGISRYTYTSDKVTGNLDGLKIVHVSDLHNKEFGKNNERLVSVISKESPDLIIISGDLVDSRRTDIEAALDFVTQAVEIAPVYYSTGNHEERLDKETYAYLLSSLEEIGANVLENELQTVYFGDDSLCIFGKQDGAIAFIGDIYNGTEKLKLMIAHKPQHIEQYANAGADIVFSGHAHGGQVRIPFIGGVLAPDQGFFPKLSEGAHTFGDTTMFISRGLGNSLCPIRVNNRPELIVVTLKN